MKQPLIIAEHWSGYLRHDGRYQGLLMKFFTFSAFRRSSLILTVSGAQRAAMISQGLKGEFEYLPNVADEKIFFADDKIQRLSDTWIHVSNLDPLEKNTSMLLSLFAHQYHAGKVKRMIVCGGTTSMVEDFRKQVVNAGLADVIEILGNISPAELNFQMNRASVFLLCSHFEGQPCVILEAILSGLVVVAPATGDIPDMLSEGRGFVFSVGNFEGAIKALDEAVSSTFLPASAEYVKNRYSSSSVGRYLFDHYSKVLE
jgi:glycosyltransferase involved in cell wall biosynthesis